MILILLCASQTIAAQDIISIDDVEVPDTIVIAPPPQAALQNTPTVVNTANNPAPENTKKLINLRGDPMRATMLSVVLPGAGQIYNKKYWKLPIVYIGFGALVYTINFNSDYFQKYYKGYIDFTDNIPETNSYLNLRSIASLDPKLYDRVLYPDSATEFYAKIVENHMLSAMNYYKRNRDLFIILTGAFYLIQILDANVDASLTGYNVNDNLELALSPTLFNMPGKQSFAGMNLRFTFNF